MSLWKIAWRSVQQRGLASFLTAVSMALGVMLVVAVLSIMGIVTESLGSTSMGYNIIVGGGKGGKLQLTLNTVYYLSESLEPVPYDYYLEFLSPQQREIEWRKSIVGQQHQAQWQTAETLSLCAAASALPGMQALGDALTLETLNSANAKQKVIGQKSKYGHMTDLVIPVCLGDYFGRFRVVATIPDMFEKLRYGPEADKQYKFSAGNNFKTNSDEHGYFEAVVGANVAREKRVKLYDRISPAHGDPDEEGHEQKFTVVGILAPTGTPNDRAVFINIEGFYLMEDHAKPLENEEPSETEAEEEDHAEVAAEDEEETTTDDDEQSQQALTPLPIEQREVSALLVRTDRIGAFFLPSLINDGDTAQAAFPLQEIGSILEFIVKPIQMVLLVLTSIICIVSGVSILVSIYNSMSDRRREIAVMRALGAGRGTVMLIILLESVFLSLAGGLMGWIGGHTLNVLASGEVERRTGVSIGFFDVVRSISIPIDSKWLEMSELVVHYPELYLIPGLILLAIIVGFLPALSAYRTDVAKSLSA